VRLALSNLASIFLLHSFFSDLIIPKCIASSFVAIYLPSIYHLYSSFVVGYCIDAVASYRIHHTYVLPRLIYGLEVLPLKEKHVENLEAFYRKSIRYVQSLPQRIATAAIYLLVGAIPIEAELHKRKCSLGSGIILEFFQPELFNLFSYKFFPPDF
jgi:hypothetical protein